MYNLYLMNWLVSVARTLSKYFSTCSARNVHRLVHEALNHITSVLSVDSVELARTRDTAKVARNELIGP